MDDVALQRDYYTRTASQYDAMHLSGDPEHEVALSAFAGLARMQKTESILDVGAGTGRAMQHLAIALPNVRVVGIEPVAALRTVGHERGIAPDSLIDGDALALPFPDNAFDFVIETGVLHHIPDPARAVAEMVRVARLGVMISDSNKYGGGRPIVRHAKSVVRSLGLWNSLIKLQTKGKMFKESASDGIFYSYSVFDNLEIIKRKFSRIHFMNTTDIKGFNIRGGATHVAIFAISN
jgi:ubiquinone/menaquinone biosynthesis C-methylase UbiE